MVKRIALVRLAETSDMTESVGRRSYLAIVTAGRSRFKLSYLLAGRTRAIQALDGLGAPLDDTFRHARLRAAYASYTVTDSAQQMRLYARPVPEAGLPRLLAQILR